MKKTKKILSLVLAAALLVTATVATTVAYLTSTTEEVNNTFTVGNVEIKLDEADVDEYGKLASSSRVTENEYKLLPGQSYIKDPTVTVVAGSERCFVRMLVEITKIDAVKAVYGDDFLPQDVVTGWSNDVWEAKSVVATNNTNVYEFWYTEVVDAREAEEDVVLPALFETIEMSGDLTNEQIALLEGVEVNVIAHAIQEAGFEGDAAAAWAEF